MCTCNVWCFVYWLFFFLVIVVVDAIKVLEKPHILKSFQEVKKANLCLRRTIRFLPYLCIPNRQNNILCPLCHSQNPDDWFLRIWGYFSRTQGVADSLLFLFAHVIWLVQMMITQKSSYLIFQMSLIIYN